MAQTQAAIPPPSWPVDRLSHGVLARTFPLDVVRAVLDECGRSGVRRRVLPAELMVYFVIALGLYRAAPMAEIYRCLVDGLRSFGIGTPGGRAPGSAALTFARQRLGTAPFQALWQRQVRPLATGRSRGCWFHGYRLMAVDGTTLTVPDERGNRAAFQLPPSARGETAFPQVRMTTLMETGTHAVVAWRHGPYRESELSQVRDLLPALTPDMLVLADRGFCGYPLWQQARATGAALLWRLRDNLLLPVLHTHADGSYDSVLMPPRPARGQAPAPVRVVTYDLPPSGTVYRLATTLSPEQASADQVAGVYHERWEAEQGFDEIKAHMLRPGAGSSTALRSKTPALVRQELHGVMLAHYATRRLAHETAIRHREDPDRISFSHTVRVIRRHLQSPDVFPPSDPVLRRAAAGRGGRGAGGRQPRTPTAAWGAPKNVVVPGAKAWSSLQRNRTAATAGVETNRLT